MLFKTKATIPLILIEHMDRKSEPATKPLVPNSGATKSNL